MIGKLTGTLDYRASDHVAIDVGGVGYLVYCSERTLGGLPGSGQPVSLFTDLLVREDVLQLFGFTSLVEKEWHRLLMGVQGIGAKASMSILGALGVDGVAQAVTLGDWAAIKVAKGVGPKTAQKVVLELKDKAPGVMALGGSIEQALTSQVVDLPGAAPGDRSSQGEALSALTNLGYAHGDAARAVTQAAADGVSGTAALIRAGLKLLGPKE